MFLRAGSEVGRRSAFVGAVYALFEIVFCWEHDDCLSVGRRRWLDRGCSAIDPLRNAVFGRLLRHFWQACLLRCVSNDGSYLSLRANRLRLTLIAPRIQSAMTPKSRDLRGNWPVGRKEGGHIASSTRHRTWLACTSRLPLFLR